MSDRQHCGTCSNVCPAGQICSGGVCALSCAAGLTNCAGVCRDLTTDRNNCNMCGNACAPGQICSSSMCMISCQTGEMNCGGICRDLTTDRNNCGGCGTICPSGQICSGSTCVISCPVGQVACGGVCIPSPGALLTCGAPGNLGTISAGMTVSSATRSQPIMGSQDFFVVSFPASPDFAMHVSGVPTIVFGQNDNNVYRFDVQGVCGSGSLSCTDRVGTGLTEWQFYDSCAAPGCMTQPTPLPATVYIRVFRTNAVSDCADMYRLTVSR
jgi:hypothetical protein